MSDHENPSHHSQESSDEEDDFDKPIIPKPYDDSPYQAETVQEIENFIVKSLKPQIKMQFIKKRKEFGQPYKLNETEAQEKSQEIRSIGDPFIHANNKVIDIGIQACNSQQQIGTQTTWNRKINKAVEIPTASQNIELEDDDTAVISFLNTVYKEMEEALQSNETIDIFQNDFDLLADDDLTVGADGGEISTIIREWKSFNYIACKQKKISCVQFQPQTQFSKSRYIAASYMENLSFDDRVTYSNKSHKNMIVLWDYDDVHNYDPVLILTSPLEIICFAFNPKDPNIIVGGAINGQVYMWDLKQSQITKVSNKKNKPINKEKAEIPELAYILASALQDPQGAMSANSNDLVRKNVPSHKNPVLNLEWLPINVEIDRKSILNHHSATGGEIHQFATISCDGQVLFWDIRFSEQKDKNKPIDLSTVIWKAIYGIQLFRPEGGGPLGGAQIAFRKTQKTTTMTVTSDEGELALVDWAVKPTDEVLKVDMVQSIWQNERQMRPTVGLDVSPFYEDIVLTLHDFHFCIWKHEIMVPIFESNVLKQTQITCGCFSPTRAGIIMIGKMDGNLDIWDLLDQSHKHTINFQVVSLPLTYIKFHDNNPHNIGIGDRDGAVHILELPTTLFRNIGDEVKTMHEFWNREVERVKYFENRFEFREESYKIEKVAREKQEAIDEANQGKQEDKKEDEDDLLEAEYQEFAQAYIREVIQGLPPKESEDKDKKKR